MFIIGEFPIGNLEVLGLSNGFRQLRPAFTFGFFQCMEEDQTGIVALKGKNIRNLAIFFLIGIDELLDARILILCSIGTGEVSLVRTFLAGDFNQFRGIPAIGP